MSHLSFHLCRAKVTPWPKPRAFTNGTAAVEIGQLSLATTSKSALLQKAFARVQAAVAQLPPSPMGMDATSTDGKLTQVHVTLSTDDETLSDKTNETYSLKVSGTCGRPCAPALEPGAPSASHILTS
jgi:hypothetical protein